MSGRKKTHILIGVITGFLNGLFGSGGGTVVVPAMERFLGMEAHKAHATAIAVILPLSALSILVYTRNLTIPWNVLIPVSAGGVLGGYLGAALLNKISGPALHRVFGAFMLAAAVRLIL